MLLARATSSSSADAVVTWIRETRSGESGARLRREVHTGSADEGRQLDLSLRARTASRSSTTTCDGSAPVVRGPRACARGAWLLVCAADVRRFTRRVHMRPATRTLDWWTHRDQSTFRIHYEKNLEAVAERMAQGQRVKRSIQPSRSEPMGSRSPRPARRSLITDFTDNSPTDPRPRTANRHTIRLFVTAPGAILSSLGRLRRLASPGPANARIRPHPARREHVRHCPRS